MEIKERELISFKERKFPKEICFKPIGIIHTPFKTLKSIPIQSVMSNQQGTIEIFHKFKSSLKDLLGFSHIYSLYFFDMVKLPVPLQSKPFLDNDVKGVFATRTPFRPNPIGISILKILDIKENIIEVNNVDILDGTPILDLKPYIPQFDNVKTKKIGWLKGKIKYKVS
ncbi:MAG: tRNA (N6-threonylcarbamoyladenosine(37)-N6)-methyltransferase TrmO [Promethearchaeota archaeon]